MNVRVHYKPYNEEEGHVVPVVAITDEVSTIDALNDLKTSLAEDGHEVLFAEDMDMKPVLDKMIHLMEKTGLSVGGRYQKSIISYYCYQGKFYHSEGMPNLHEGLELEEYELRERLQAHYTSLDEEERKQDMQYVEDKYAELEEMENPAPAFEIESQGVFFHMEDKEVINILDVYDNLDITEGLDEEQRAICLKLYQSLSEDAQKAAIDEMVSIDKMLRDA